MRSKRVHKSPPLAGQALLCVTRRFWLYLGLLALAFVSTQILLSKVSALFFWFVLLLPIPLLVWVLAARLCIRATVEPETATVSKMTPCPYRLCIRNSAPLLFPFLEAYASLPQEDSVRCTTRLLRFSLLPLATYCFEDTVSFPFRGTYELGVETVYAYDLFRLFRVRIPVQAQSRVAVLPRLPLWEADPAEEGAIGAECPRWLRLATDGEEWGENRTYRAGDPLKRIHWKLSSRSEEPIVRESCAGSSMRRVLLCDLSPRCVEPASELGGEIDLTEDINEYLADGVVEMALAYVQDQLSQGHELELCWFDGREGGGLRSLSLSGIDALPELIADFGTAPLVSPARSLEALLRAVETAPEVRLVYALPLLDPETVTLLERYGAQGEVLAYEPEARLNAPDQRRRYLDGCQEQLAAAGLSLTVCRCLTYPAERHE